MPAFTANLGRYRDCFLQKRTAAHFDTYCRGLLSDLPRKTVDPIARQADIAVGTLQGFLVTGRWDHRHARDLLQQHLAEAVAALPADPLGTIVIIDEARCHKGATRRPGCKGSALLVLQQDGGQDLVPQGSGERQVEPHIYDYSTKIRMYTPVQIAGPDYKEGGKRTSPVPSNAARADRMTAMTVNRDSTETDHLLRRAAAGDRDALGLLLQRDRERLRRAVALRLDRRLAGRVDPSDVLQEAQLEAASRLAEYLQNPTIPFFLWLRLITLQRVLTTHRRHLGAQARAAGREVSLDRGLPQATSAALAAQLLGRMTSPSNAAIRAEMKARLHEALEQMDAADRAVLTLRHFEQLTAAEAALELGISEEAVKKRHIRALKRLKQILTDVLGEPRKEVP